MSRSQITCPQCKQLLAEKTRSGRKVKRGYIEGIVGAISAYQVHDDGIKLVCKACGTEKFLHFAPPTRQPRDVAA